MPGVHITITNVYDLEKKDFWDIVSRIYDRLIIRTPYDTGECTNAWEIDYVSRDEVEIWNDTEYISYLEDGHSKQAPNGWIENTLNSYKEIVYDYFNT